ncbi:uncharacterized protein LTR77_011172 [Saxophila tyrrhenica]|uniref:Arylsulfatase n=1 Tax=Saxophila tyrrhenica TaxID=1690608 RepID=A0AAV9NTA2_9PEZI|nr:hypothetical protein LTR77_011172 [Saxophila tyrrhenica]
MAMRTSQIPSHPPQRGLDDSTSEKEDSPSETQLSTSGDPTGPRKVASTRWSCPTVAAIGILCITLLALGLGLGLVLTNAASASASAPASASSSTPAAPTTSAGSIPTSGANVVVIMTDDQDLILDSLSVQPNVRNLIGGEGVTYNKHYCTVAICCPSRVNFFTGRAAHNTNITSIRLPYGGWTRFAELGLNENYLPVWLSDAGVNTYYAGKFLNGLDKSNIATPAPPNGWSDSSFLVEPWTYNYLNSHYTNKPNAATAADITGYKGMHTTEVLEEKALAMIDDAASKGGQFYMQIAPEVVECHADPNDAINRPAKYEAMFADRQAPRTSNFNPVEPSGASWVKDLELLSDDDIATIDEIYRSRLGNMAYVDDMVGSMIQRLEDHGLLENTYFIYTSDNGFHMGQHRLHAGKRCPYEEDINIPLLIRGPDVAKGATSEIVGSHTDMAPTILQMLGLPLREEFDGQPIAYTSTDLGTSEKTELVTAEFWNIGGGTPQAATPGSYYNNTYKSLRLISDDYTFLYTVWCTGEQEFYDMQSDPGQMINRLASPPQGIAAEYYGRSEQSLYDRLDALLMVTKSCAAESCREPWSVLFPGGEIGTLMDAMNSEYDSFFANQPKVGFSSCADGYIVELEGPQDVTPYT